MRYLLAAAILCLAGCFHFNPISNNTNLNEVDFSNAKNWKRGEGCDHYITIFGPMRVQGHGNSVVQAAIDGGIKRVYAVESRYLNFIIALRVCTIVYGE